MGATTWEAMSIPLKNGEGELKVLVQQWEKPDESKTNSIRLDSGPTISHGPHPFCGGLIRFVRISESKNIFHCERCGLRISFHPSAVTLGELAQYLSNA